MRPNLVFDGGAFCTLAVAVDKRALGLGGEPRSLDGTVQPSSGHFPLNINTVTDRDQPQGHLEDFHVPLQSRVCNTVKSYYLKYFTGFF